MTYQTPVLRVVGSAQTLVLGECAFLEETAIVPDGGSGKLSREAELW